MTLLLFVAGLAVLTLGADLLVRGASRIAAWAGIPPLVIGLTVVALGTSAPEIAVSVGSSLAGRGNLAVGNVVGSNVLNVLLVLGLSALLTPIAVSRGLVRREIPVLVAVSAAVLWMAVDGRIGRGESTLLLAAAVLYLGTLARHARRTGAGDDPGSPGPPAGAAPGDGSPEGSPGAGWRSPIQVILGLAGLVLGADWIVGAATAAAQALGVSELVVGLTVVALGTSLPELATCVAAAARREVDLLVGNVVGSNILNLAVVLGASGLVSIGGLEVPPAAWSFDLPIMVAVAVACVPIFFTGYRISRWEGAFFLVFYGAYVLFLLLDATGHAAVPRIRAMAAYVLPLTIVTAAVVVVHHRRGREAGA